MKITRRDFLKTTALTSLYFAGFGGTAYSNTGTKKNLVIIMLRGGMDGLCAIPIKGDKNFDNPDKIMKYLNQKNRIVEKQTLLFNHPEFLRS